MEPHGRNVSLTAGTTLTSALLLALSLVLLAASMPAHAESIDSENIEPNRHESNVNPFDKIKSFFDGGTETEVDSADTAARPDQQTYNGPRARIIISRVRDKTNKGWYNNRLGRAMADQLATALFNSGRFEVMERAAFEDIIEEQNLGRTGLTETGTTPRSGRIQGADLGVVASITAAEGIGGGAGGGGFGSGGVLVGVLSSVERSYIAMELRIVDLENSRIIAATTVEGTSTDVNIAGVAGSLVGGAALGGALASWNDTPQGQALRVVIAEAVTAISRKTPQRYFRYGGGAKPRQAANKKVQSVQAKLNDLGFEAGPADGIMGPKTRSAISDFQAAQGIEQTGSLNLDTIKALQSSANTAPKASEKIRNVQELLRTLGHYAGEANGLLNQETQDALSEFQIQNGLEATGKLNVETLQTLKEVSEALQSLSSQAEN